MALAARQAFELDGWDHVLTLSVHITVIPRAVGQQICAQVRAANEDGNGKWYSPPATLIVNSMVLSPKLRLRCVRFQVGAACAPLQAAAALGWADLAPSPGRQGSQAALGWPSAAAVERLIS